MGRRVCAPSGTRQLSKETTGITGVGAVLATHQPVLWSIAKPSGQKQVLVGRDRQGYCAFAGFGKACSTRMQTCAANPILVSLEQYCLLAGLQEFSFPSSSNGPHHTPPMELHAASTLDRGLHGGGCRSPVPTNPTQPSGSQVMVAPICCGVLLVKSTFAFAHPIAPNMSKEMNNLRLKIRILLVPGQERTYA